MRQRLSVVLAACAAFFATAGCNIVPHKAYEGASRPERDLSILKTGAYGDADSPMSLTDMRTIDGVAQRSGMYLASVLPGRHFVGVTETTRMGTYTRSQHCAFELDTFAGCTYTPRPPSPPSDAIANRVKDWEWSVDMTTGIECRDGAAYQMRIPARCGSSAKLLERSR
jgi:hypothetical protein